jgi:iron complex outermembrane receptor protein
MGNKTNIILSGGYITEKKGLSGTIENPTPYSRKKSDMYSSSLHIKSPVFSSKTSIGNVDVRNSDSSKSTNSKLDVKKIKQNFSGSLKTETMGNFHSGLGVYKGMVSSSQYGEHDEDIFHIFISDSFNLLDMDFGLGSRLNNYSEFENTLTHEFKVAKNIETCSLTFLYNRSNTIPSFYKRYNETSSTKPNPDLQMEISDNFSITSTYRHEKMFTLMGTIFYNSLTDRITYEKSSDGTGSYKNTGKASYKGVEVSTSIALKPVLIKLSYMYMEARDDITDLFLTSRPLNRANCYIFFTIMSNLTFAVDIKYTGKQYNNKENTEFVEEYTIANLKLEYKGSGYNVFGEIKNVADKSYIYTDGIEGRPLTYMAGINFKF